MNNLHESDPYWESPRSEVSKEPKSDDLSWFQKFLLTLSTIIFVLTIMCGVAEVMNVGVRGKWLNDKNDYEMVQGLLHRANFEDTHYSGDNYIYCGSAYPMINSGFTACTHYYISGYGPIPRWTKMDSAIHAWIDSSKLAIIKRLKQ